MIIYQVDDCIFYAKNKTKIDEIIDSIKRFLREKGEDVAGFLRLQIERDIQVGIITLTQTGLLDQILECMKMQESNIEYTPVDKYQLGKNEDSSTYIEE